MVSFAGANENALELSRGRGCTALWMYKCHWIGCFQMVNGSLCAVWILHHHHHHQAVRTASNHQWAVIRPTLPTRLPTFDFHPLLLMNSRCPIDTMTLLFHLLISFYFQCLFVCSSLVMAGGLWSTWALVALWHVESSQTRDWTRVPCLGRQILNHWTTREV